MLEKAIMSFLNTKLNVKLIIVDNSPTDTLRSLRELNQEKIEYIHNPTNPGFGAAHNIAIKKIIDISPYHLILNPDIYFDEGVNEYLISYLLEHKDVGVVMPKITYPNGATQYVAKLLPTPFNFFVRRIMPFNKIKEKVNTVYELRESNYDKIMEVPYLSGCYLVVKTEVVKQTNGFDEKFFMHCEDIDFCRTILKSGYKTIFNPVVKVVHAHEAKSMQKLNNLKIYLTSMIYYFNKWGWFFDIDRKKINKKTLKQFK